MTGNLFLTAILFLAVSAGPPPGPGASPIVVTLPAQLHLGDLAPGSTVKRSVWLVNKGPQPASVLRALGDCGCTAVDFQPATLQAWAAIEVPLTIRAPRGEGESKSVNVHFTIEGAAPLRLPVQIETRGAAEAPPQDVAADPPQLDLGTVVAGSTMSTSVRLVNHGAAPRTITAARSSCPCMRVVDFSELVLGPGAAADVQLEVDVPASAGSAARALTLLVEGERPLRVPLRMRSSHPAMDAAQRELARTLAAGLACEDFQVQGDTVTAVAWDRERALPQGLVTCIVDAGGRVTSVRFDPLRPATRAEG